MNMYVIERDIPEVGTFEREQLREACSPLYILDCLLNKADQDTRQKQQRARHKGYGGVKRRFAVS